MIPKQTTPLVKFVRSGEGVLVYAFGLILVLVPIITNNLPPALATSLGVGKWVAIVTVVSRSGLKAIAQLSTVTGLTPVTPAGLPDASTVGGDVAAAAADVDQVLAQIAAAEKAAAVVQATVGVSAEGVRAGLAPDPNPPPVVPVAPVVPVVRVVDGPPIPPTP